ncbi:unnamed protein product [Brugia pahangi]|uniref:Ovule protein n=1 Tax=Brugia pahangi TaxID=6280 RepID=A0A0N4TNA3_BRUPA|nr:unnamed protein product [Brugia pahangi]
MIQHLSLNPSNGSNIKRYDRFLITVLLHPLQLFHQILRYTSETCLQHLGFPGRLRSKPSLQICSSIHHIQPIGCGIHFEDD